MRFLCSVSKAILLAVVFASLTAFAEGEVQELRPLGVRVQAGDQLVISGFKGSLKLVEDANAKDVSVRVRQNPPKASSDELAQHGDEWLFSLQREGDKILAKVGSPASKTAWAKMISNENLQPEFHITIKSPALPVKISWRTGTIKIADWNSSIELTSIKSETSLRGGEGILSVSQQSGRVEIAKRIGPVSVDSYDATIASSEIQGSLYVKNFNGLTKVNSIDGKLEFHSYSGQFEVAEGKGQIQYESERGKIKVSQFEGDLTSKTDIGSVQAKLVGKSRVKIRTKRGNVSLRMPNSGANVNLGTEKGNLNVPNYLRFTRLPNLRLMTGRLRGKNSGRVYVRTESGEIRLR